MALSTSWRLMLKSRSGGNNTLSLAEVTLYGPDGEFAGGSYGKAGVPTSANDHWGGSETPDKAYDNNIGTWWAGPHASGQGLWRAGPYATQIEVSSIGVVFRDDALTLPDTIIVQRDVGGTWVNSSLTYTVPTTPTPGMEYRIDVDATSWFLPYSTPAGAAIAVTNTTLRGRLAVSAFSAPYRYLRYAITAGATDLVIGDASLNVGNAASYTTNGAFIPVTFGGNAGMTIPAGQLIYTDPIDTLSLDLTQASARLHFSLHVVSGQIVTGSDSTRQLTGQQAGNQVDNASGASFTNLADNRSIITSIQGTGTLVAALSQSFGVQWDIVSQIAKSFATQWDIAEQPAQIEKSFGIAWNIQEQIAKSFSTQWNIAAAYTQIDKSFGLSWNILAPNAQIDKSFGVSWDIDAQLPISKSFGIGWDIEAPASQIGKSFGLAWAIEQSFADLGRMIVPDYPITEVWHYQTSVFRSESGKEQRRARVVRPVITQQFTAPSFDPVDFWNTRRVMEIDTAEFYPVPMFQYYAYLTAPAFAGDDRLYFDPGRANVVVGQYVTLLAENDEPVLSKVELIHDDGVTLAVPLTIDLHTNYFACAVLFSRISANGETSHSSVHAYSTYSFVSAERELDFLRPGNTETLPTLGGVPLLDKYIRANDEVKETFLTGNVVIDNARGNPVMFYNEPTRRNFDVQYITNREKSPAQLDYWRKFFDTVRGAQKPFAVPTFRPDAYTTDTVQPGDTVVVLLGRDFFDVFQRGGYIGLAFGVQALALECSHVLTVELIAGNSACVLADPIVGTSGYDVASFVMLMRASDEVVLQHDDVNTVLSFNVQMVQA